MKLRDMHYYQFAKLMRQLGLCLLGVLFAARLLDAEVPIALDLSAQHPQIQSILDTGVRAKAVTENGTQMVLQPALYEVKIRGGVRFLIDCFYMDYSSTELKYRSDGSIIPRDQRDDHSRLGYLKLQARDMTYEEAQAMSDAFHDAFGLDKRGADLWLLDLADDGIARGSYRASTGDNYPQVSFNIDETYSAEKPAKLLFEFSWAIRNESALARSKKAPTLQNINYDMPKILADLQHTDVLEESAEPVVEAVEEAVLPEPATEEPAEVVVTEPVEKDVEQSSNWWLWLIGLLAVFAGVGLAVRRKN